MSTQEDPPWPEGTLPPVLMDWVGDLFEYLKAQRVVQGPGVFIGDAVGGGKQITATGGGAGVNADDNFPFKVFIQNNTTGNQALWQRGVYYNSPIQPTIDVTPDNLVYPTGLLSVNPKRTDLGWKHTEDGDFIWCKIEFDTGNPDNPFEINTASIKSTGAGDSFKWPAIYVKNGDDPDATYEQTELNIPIASVTFDAIAKRPVLDVQYARNLMRLVGAAMFAKDSAGSNLRGISGLYYTA